MRNKLPRLMLTLFVAGIFFCSILPFAEPVSVIHDASCRFSDAVFVQALDWMPPEVSDQESEICEAKGRCNEEQRPNEGEPHNDNGPPSNNTPQPSKNTPQPSKNAPPPSNNGPTTDNGQTTNDNGPTTDNGQTTNDNESNFSAYLSAFGRVLFLLF